MLVEFGVAAQKEAQVVFMGQKHSGWLQLGIVVVGQGWTIWQPADD